MLTCALWSDFFNSLTFAFTTQASMKMTACRNLLNSCRLDIENSCLRKRFSQDTTVNIMLIFILEYGFQKSNRKRKLAWCENRVSSSKVIFSDDSGAKSLHYVNMFCSLPSSLCILKIVAVPSMPLLVVM